jgi:hypothetical protein
MSQRVLDALRGMVGLVQLVQNRYPDFPVDNHRVIEAMSALNEAERPGVQSEIAPIPDVLGQVEAALRKNPLIAMFLDQGFWHAHHVDIVIRQDSKDRHFEADWIKDIWYIVRRRGLTATQAVRAEQLSGGAVGSGAGPANTEQGSGG